MGDVVAILGAGKEVDGSIEPLKYVDISVGGISADCEGAEGEAGVSVDESKVGR